MTFPSNWPVTFLISFHLAHISPYVDLEPILSTWRPIFHLIWCGKLRAFLHRPKTNIKKLKRGFFQIPYIFLNTSRTECKFECSFQLPLTENYFHIARKMSVTSFQMLLSSQILSDLWDLTRVAVSRFFSSSSAYRDQLWDSFSLLLNQGKVNRLGRKLTTHSIQCPAENVWRYASTPTRLFLAELSTGVILLTEVKYGQ